MVKALPEIPLIEDLTTGPIPAGSNLLVEFDPASQWYNASLTIAAGWLRTGGRVLYNAAAQRPDKIRSQLKRQGLDPESLESEDKLEIFDYYTAGLGLKSAEKLAYDSLKVADLSILWSKGTLHAPPEHESSLRIHDSLSPLARFNDEKAWVEFLLTRVIASTASVKAVRICGITSGLHSDWVYKALEAAVDGIIDMRLQETGEERHDVLGIRVMRNVGFDRRWHDLKFGENFEVTLEK